VPTLEVDGVRLCYERSGGGEPIVLLHGFTSSYVENWVETGWVQSLLTEGFGVVGMDVRGHGRSTKLYAAAAYETSVLAGDVVAILDRLRIDRAHAVGFSMGAGIALQLALDHPARVGAVVVAGIGDKAIRGRHDAAEIRAIERGLKAGTAGDGAETNSLVGRIRRNAERAGNDRRALATFFERGGWPGDLVSVREVAAPVLVVLAEHDEFMPTAEELVRKLGARVSTVDCGHAAVRDPRFLELALSFIREHRLANGH
jgi:pimeloyl-ACP methyl ester carboxylesterase